MYTGQMWMPDFAAYHYKARAYRPDLGRFLQTDPVGYAQGLNLYAYVANDPVNATDPTGMSCEKQGEQYACVVDGTKGALTDEDRENIYEFSGNYTAVVNDLMADPDRPATSSMTLSDGSVVTISTTAGQIGRELIARNVIADVSDSGVNTDGSLTLADTASFGRQDTTRLTAAGLGGAGGDPANLIIHEGIHGSTGENMAIPNETRRAREIANDRHNGPYQVLVNILLRRPR